MLPSVVSSFNRSHFAVVASALTSLLYRPLEAPIHPNTPRSLYRCNTYRSSGSLFSINSAIPSEEFGVLIKKSVPFSIGLSQLSYTTPSFSTMGSSSTQGNTSIYDFAVKDIKGNNVDLSQYKGKVLLVVNVASECGLTTSNYKEMNELYAKYKDQGLEILAFPCNQFAGQEPGSNEQIAEVACTRFKAEFPIFDKVDVNGENAAPIYKFLKSSKGSFFGDNIKWNFTKFLVDKDGNVVERYAPTTSPLNIEKKMKKLLGVA